MNGLPYYKAYPRDFIDGTVGMDLETKGAYRIVLDLIYLHGGALPDDSRYIAGQLGCSVRKWNGIRDTLIGVDKLRTNEGRLTNERAIIELETIGKFQDKQRENATGPRKNKDLQKPRQGHTDTDTYRDPPNPPRGDFVDFWKAWPNQVAEVSAARAWKKLSPAEQETALVSAASWFAWWRKAHPTSAPISATKFLSGKRWNDAGFSAKPPPPVDIRSAIAERIRSGKEYLVRDITPATARELIAAGFVTEDECRKAGIA